MMHTQSLLHPAQQSLRLADGSAIDEAAQVFAADRLESRGEHTAARVFERDPQLYRAVVAMYATGMAGQLRIADTLSMSVHTVRAIIEREGIRPDAAMGREKTISRLADLTEMTIETLMDKLADPEQRKKLPIDRALIALGIMIDKHELLAGNATQRIEHTDGARPSVDDFRDWLQAGSIETTATETRIEGEKNGQKAAALIGQGDGSTAGTAADVLGNAPETPGGSVTTDPNIEDVGGKAVNAGESLGNAACRSVLMPVVADLAAVGGPVDAGDGAPAYDQASAAGRTEAQGRGGCAVSSAPLRERGIDASAEMGKGDLGGEG